MYNLICPTCRDSLGLRKFKELHPAELAPVRALLIEFNETYDLTKKCESGEELMDAVDKIASTTKKIYKIITKIHLNDLKTFGEANHE